MKNPAEAILTLIILVNGFSVLFLLIEAFGAPKSKQARASLLALIPLVGLFLACVYSSKDRKAK